MAEDMPGVSYVKRPCQVSTNIVGPLNINPEGREMKFPDSLKPIFLPLDMQGCDLSKWNS
jgi:hypothetical protein